MSYRVEVLADSFGPHGVRLTTIEATFPRSYLAEINTHRALSRNSESSRAVPTELRIERVRNDPYIPDFASRVKGMGVGDPLDPSMEQHTRATWLEARDAAVRAAEELCYTAAKDQVSRLLEPFMWHTAIISATEWDNFLNLRDHKDAAPPMRRLAAMIRKALSASQPIPLRYGDWHLPLLGSLEVGLADLNNEFGARVSAGRCARSSYSTHHNPETANESEARWQRLAGAGHWSPAEHPAQCVPDLGFIGNYRGFRQLRKLYPMEAVFQG